MAIIKTLFSAMLKRTFPGVTPQTSLSHSSEWTESYLIGQSDMDAIWYCERHRWLKKD